MKSFIQNSESNINNDKTKINSEIMAVEDGKVKIEELVDISLLQIVQFTRSYCLFDFVLAT